MTTDETCLAARQTMASMRDRIDDDAALKWCAHELPNRAFEPEPSI